MLRDQISEITVLPGTNRAGEKEGFDRITMRPGDTLSIVGPTGSGKSAFINDIEVLAQADTVTGRRILVNGVPPSDEMARDPSKKPIALITQSTRVIADLDVSRFLELHIEARKQTHIKDLVEETIALANEFTGEQVTESMDMTALSGGQTRALLIADAILIGRTPILLLDEVENAGIFKERVISCIKECKKNGHLCNARPLSRLKHRPQGCNEQRCCREGTRALRTREGDYCASLRDRRFALEPPRKN